MRPQAHGAKALLRGLALVWPLAACAPNDARHAEGHAAGAYAVRGNLGEFVVAGEAELSRSTGTLGDAKPFQSAAIVDGRFVLEGLVASPRPQGDAPRAESAQEPAQALGPVFLTVYNPDGNQKGRAQFILESGEIVVEHRGPTAGLVAVGGAYNQKVIASWRDGDAYQKVLADYAAAMRARRELADDDERMEDAKEESVRLYQERHRLRREALRAIAEAPGDPLASLFAIELGGLGREPALARLDELAPRIGDFVPMRALRSRLATGVRFRKTAQVVKAGAPAPVFSAPDPSGVSHALADAIAANRLVLLEFWASWCGPCRAEYPHLKQAYERYHEDGFEVFAFSLDEDKDDWVLASEEDGIPWINTGDLSAYESPVPALYGVLAIPMSFLIDADGVILARSLRGDALHAKLAELFENAPS